MHHIFPLHLLKKHDACYQQLIIQYLKSNKTSVTTILMIYILESQKIEISTHGRIMKRSTKGTSNRR
jgi:branched-subunit amino acid transport protein AzlD